MRYRAGNKWSENTAKTGGYLFDSKIVSLKNISFLRFAFESNRKTGQAPIIIISETMLFKNKVYILVLQMK